MARDAVVIERRKVTITARDVIYRDKLLSEGATLEVEAPLADSWLRSGRAKPGLLIAIKFVKSAFFNNRSWFPGDQTDATEFFTRLLYANDLIEILEPLKLTEPLPPRRESPTIERVIKFVRLVKAIVTTKSLPVAGRVFGRGDGIALPEDQARLGLEVKAIELAPGETLSEPPPKDAITIPAAS
jgi:hypothetical protein